MSFLSRINNTLPSQSKAAIPGLMPVVQPSFTDPLFNTLKYVGNEITLYPEDHGQVYIDKGFHYNDAVYSIISKNAEKAAQIRLYPVKVKREEKKTLQEYLWLQKGAISREVLTEMKRMRKSMVDERIVNSPLTKLLAQPNRNDTWAEFMERLFILRESQGEGNIWLNTGDGNQTGPILEMFPIPKQHLNLVGNGRDPFEIIRYLFNLNGNEYRWDKENVVMWKYSNGSPISTTLEHLRGLAPLKSFLVALQGMNEADKNLATSNANAGAKGFAFRKDAGNMEIPKPAMDSMRAQFDSIVNNSAMASKVALLNGEWDYRALGATVEEQQILEQYSVGFKRLCRVFKTPPGIFGEANDTYENQKQYERHWIYSKIAPAVYQARDQLSSVLLPRFGLDPETNLIDCDIMSLPEMAQDFKESSAAYKDANWLSKNEKRIATGYEPLSDAEYDFVPKDEDFSQIGGNLDAEQNLLNQ